MYQKHRAAACSGRMLYRLITEAAVWLMFAYAGYAYCQEHHNTMFATIVIAIWYKILFDSFKQEKPHARNKEVKR